MPGHAGTNPGWSKYLKILSIWDFKGAGCLDMQGPTQDSQSTYLKILSIWDFKGAGCLAMQGPTQDGQSILRY